MSCPSCDAAEAGIPPRAVFIHGFVTGTVGTIMTRLRSNTNTAQAIEQMIASFCEACERELNAQTNAMLADVAEEARA